MLVASVLWIPIVAQGGNNGQLFTYITGIGNVMTTPILAVFLLAVIWPRATEQVSLKVLLFLFCYLFVFILFCFLFVFLVSAY